MPRKIYKYGLYARCTSCKEIELIKCKYCGESYYFTDSSKAGHVLCTNCNTHNMIVCDKKTCNFQPKTYRTPKNEDEKNRIDQFIEFQKNQKKDRRKYVFNIDKKIEEQKNSKPDIKSLADEKEDIEIIKTEPSENLKKVKKEKEKVLDNKRSSDKILFSKSKLEKQKEEEQQKNDMLFESVDESDKILDLDERPDESKKAARTPLKKTDTPQTPEKKEDKPVFTPDDFKKEIVTETKEERRVVNNFFDTDDETAIDKKVNFNLNFSDTVFYDCAVCGEEESKLVCDKCGKNNEFSLDYDYATCSCGNEVKTAHCRCGAKIRHGKFYLISDGVKWRYSRSKSYYNYRKGRLLAFSTCPTCNLFLVEKCTNCGSKVNFGMPNKNNEIYCKNCGTINKFPCENPKCNGIIKRLKNPSSIEEKFDWLNKVMNFKFIAQNKKTDKPQKKTEDKALASVAESVEGQFSFTNSFIEQIDKQTKDVITNSFMDEIEEEIEKKKTEESEVDNHNKQFEAEYEEEYDDEYEYYDEEMDDYEKPKSKTGLIILTIIIILAAGALAYLYFVEGYFN